jgi:hypothetical protein
MSSSLVRPESLAAARFVRWLAVAMCVASCASGPETPRTTDDGGTSFGDSGLGTCARPFDRSAALVASARGLHFSELLSANDGVNVDEDGETDDWLELSNDGTTAIDLSTHALSDANGKHWKLPNLTVEPGQVILLWADDDQKQGIAHLGVKLSASGEQLTLWSGPCTAIDRVDLPAMPDNESFARIAPSGLFTRCRYATPGRNNGTSCDPPPPPELPPEASFQEFTWPASWPTSPTPLAITELALRPATFVEVQNTSAQAVSLADYTLRLAAVSPDAPYPLPSQGNTLLWPATTLAPGERLVVPISAVDTQELEANDGFEGIALLSGPGATQVDRVEFNEWPTGAVLARVPDAGATLRFCAAATPGTNNVCSPLASRPIADRAHSLATPNDFATLTAGGTESGQAALKFLVDLSAHDAVHFIDNARWALHYTFVRERIYLEPPLDRCDEAQNDEFNKGWYKFSDLEYFKVDGRRFLLGTLVKYSNGVLTVEFTPGDEIDAAQMKRAFTAVVARTEDPRAWSLRPADAAQTARMRVLDGTLPIVDRNAPFADLTYQPLTRAEGFGVLRYVPGAQLASTALGPDTIVITDDVPNDVPLVSGLITEAFQAPLAHVNVLSEARGTPNMALRGAREHARVKPLIGKLVRLEVGPQDFTLREASATEADAFWQRRRPAGARIAPPSNLTQRELVSLRGRGPTDLPAIGAKAAQFAELYRVQPGGAPCGVALTFRVPDQAFAVPVVHYDEHFTQSGARALLTALLADPMFRADSSVRTAGLASVRSAIMGHPVESGLLSQVSALVRERFGDRRVRFRSSSNTEDLPTFNGAGLHTSISAQLNDSTRNVDDALRTVWASLWNLRAYDERENANLEQTASLMGVLVHEQFGGEAAQGVAISRNMLDVTRDDSYTINTQIGEANVTNPAPGVITELLLYSLPPTWLDVRYQTLSSLSGGQKILRENEPEGPSEIVNLACALHAVHNHFRPLLDPQQTNRLFAMQIEFKLERDRTLVVKQARPQPFGHLTLPTDCR